MRAGVRIHTFVHPHIRTSAPSMVDCPVSIVQCPVSGTRISSARCRSLHRSVPAHHRHTADNAEMDLCASAEALYPRPCGSCVRSAARPPTAAQGLRRRQCPQTALSLQPPASSLDAWAQRRASRAAVIPKRALALTVSVDEGAEARARRKGTQKWTRSILYRGRFNSTEEKWTVGDSVDVDERCWWQGPRTAQSCAVTRDVYRQCR
ncbi:hypothetical protein GY45DRAFT_507595 [Cubamyces sp. BRFM 1775]|nr:hypothetical protein GY45DRAFT_507595 [Cubamyces sp. BRFM 1775]